MKASPSSPNMLSAEISFLLSVPDFLPVLRLQEAVCPTVCAEMIELILKSFPDLAKGKLDTCSFTQIADLFFKYISVADRAAFFEKSFTETNLSASHQDFINKIDWPYIYTINFDDGIERCGKYRAILPYKKFNIPKTSKKLSYTNFTVMLSTRPSTQALPMMLTKTLSSATANTGIPSSAVRTAISSII
jgi:hypothetical protein